eukprot:SAG31_NODE_21458_length_549_cov_0.908889_1_plen_35_part_10
MLIVIFIATIIHIHLVSKRNAQPVDGVTQVSGPPI